MSQRQREVGRKDVDLGSVSRPKLGRMVTLILESSQVMGEGGRGASFSISILPKCR